MKKFIKVQMPDHSEWVIPVAVIAKNHAEYFSSEFDGDIKRSLKEDTEPLFEDLSEAIDWMYNNMDWSDVKDFAVLALEAPKPDYDEMWGRSIVVGVFWIK